MPIAKLGIDFEARLGQFENELKRITKVADGISSQLTSAFGAVGLSIAGIGSALSVGAFAASINNTIKFAASLDDMAERTGATVENLSALSGVAKIGGHDLGMVETSVIKLNKALHGSDDESKGAAKALAAIGLSIDDLRAKDPAAALLDIATALDKFKDGGGKSAAAIAILGKAGADALPFLKDLAEKGELVGKITAEQAAQAEKYEKNMVRLTTSLSSFSKTVALEMIPMLASMTSELNAGAKAAGGFWNFVGQSLSTNPLKSLYENIKAVSAEASGLEDKLSIGRGTAADQSRLDKLNAQLKTMRAIDDQRKSTMADGLGINDIEKKGSLDDLITTPTPKVPKGPKPKDDYGDLIKSLNEKISVETAALASTEKLNGAQKEYEKYQADIRSGALKLSDAQQKVVDKYYEVYLARVKEKEFNDAVNKQTETNRQQNAAMEDRIRLLDKEIELYGLTESQISFVEQSKLDEAIATATLNGADEAHLATIREELRLRGNLTDALIRKDTKKQEIDDATAKVKDSTDQMGEFAKQAARNMQDAMAEFFIDPTKKGMQSIAETFGQTVQKMIAQAASAQLGKLLFGNMDKTGNMSGLVGDMFKKMGGAFGGASAASAYDYAAFDTLIAGFANGGIMTSAGPLPLRAYSGGGIANTPQLSLYGEGRTPEAYVPLPDGRRIPVHMQGEQGGMNITQHIVVGANADRADVKRAAAAGARSVLGVMAGSRRYA